MKTKSQKPIYLFSIDLEDIRDMIHNGHALNEHVPMNTYRYLEFLKNRKANVTFFVVGDVARNYPELIQQILAEGHEIACHSDKHIPLDQLDAEALKRDLDANINALLKAGATNIQGFRAPIFSITEKNTWVYQYLSQAGITYSSSVLPIKNFQYGWESFGKEPRVIEGVLELPMSVFDNRYLPYPFGGGAYFRVLPGFLIKRAFKNAFRTGQTVLGYFHPYDIDTEQKGYQFPNIKNKFYNYLMFYNRKNVFRRLKSLEKLDYQMMSYQQYIKQYLSVIQ